MYREKEYTFMHISLIGTHKIPIAQPSKSMNSDQATYLVKLISDGDLSMN